MNTYRLVVVQRRLTHYRVPFFEQLKSRLATQGVDLSLVVGDPTPNERTKNDEGHVPWAQHVACRYWWDGRLCWQNLTPSLIGCDAVVVTQENKLLNNLPLLLGRHPYRVALWGHGRNLQAGASAASQWAQSAKSALSRRADWWFAYTEKSADIVRGFGFPAERITSLNNSIDSRRLQAQVNHAKTLGRAGLRRSLGLGDGPLGLFIGSVYADKRIDLLIAGARLVRQRCPSFEVAVIGSGPLADSLQQQVRDEPWFRVVGAVHGDQKAQWLACADVMLNPGLVGLGILDSFAAEVPMVTTDCGVHSPEIAYLDNGVNGLMTAPDPDAFATGVAALLGDEVLASTLRAGCVEASHAYSLEAMVERFSDGVERWRAAPRHRKVETTWAAQH